MAEELSDDPREVPWHPRLATDVVGHEKARDAFTAAFASGKPHHAWLITGSKGCGKATLAYKLAEHVLAQTNPTTTARWIAARAHPDLFVLEPSLSDTKPRQPKRDIAVDDARRIDAFFSHTASGTGWRVGIVDAADNLNTESANALLKLVEEPPAKSLLLLVCSQPGAVLRTLKSRCRRLPLDPLTDQQTLTVMERLPLPEAPDADSLQRAVALAKGAPGQALALLKSEGAKAFEVFSHAKMLDMATRTNIANRFSQRQSALADHDTFMTLLLDWLATTAQESPATRQCAQLALAHQKISTQMGTTNAFNLDRRNAVLAALELVNDALKAA